MINQFGWGVTQTGVIPKVYEFCEGVIDDIRSQGGDPDVLAVYGMLAKSFLLALKKANNSPKFYIGVPSDAGEGAYGVRGDILYVNGTRQPSGLKDYHSVGIVAIDRWHHSIVSQDPLFGSVTSFVEQILQLVERDSRLSPHLSNGYPNAVTAAGAASYVVMQSAVSESFREELPAKVELRRDAIRKALTKTDLNTIYGRVSFDEYSQNVGRTLVAWQISANQNATPLGKIIFPGELAEAHIVFPFPTWESREGCPRGTRNTGTECEACPPNTFIEVHSHPGVVITQCEECPPGTGTPEDLVGAIKCTIIEDDVGSDESDDSDDSSTIVFVVAGVSVGSLVCITCLALYLWNLQEKKKVEQSEQVALKLLDGICEAVVRLNANLYVSRPSEKLATMLLRNSDKTGLQKLYFPNLAVHIEIDRIKSHIESTNAATSLDDKPAYPLHTTLLDAVGTKVQVQLHVVCIQGRRGYKRYLVGVSSESKENEDVADLAASYTRSQNSGLQADFDASPSSGSEHSTTDDMDEPPSFTFTMGKVVSANPSFGRFIGKPPSDIFQMFANPDPFRKFCIEKVNGHYGPAKVYAQRGKPKRAYSVVLNVEFGIDDGVANATFAFMAKMSKIGTPASTTKESVSDGSPSVPHPETSSSCSSSSSSPGLESGTVRSARRNKFLEFKTSYESENRTDKVKKTQMVSL